MSRQRLSPLFTWRSALADSKLPPLARLVAMTLSLHMSERGDSCFPSLKTQARETGLSRSTVAKYLALLEHEGWIRRKPGGVVNGENVPTHYFAADVVRGTDSPVRDTDDRSPSDDQGVLRLDDGGSPGDGHEGVSESVNEVGRHCYIDNCTDPVAGRFPRAAGEWWCSRHLEEQLS